MYRGSLDMNARCPVCALVFEREPGYFTGAMVVSYLLAVAVYGALVLLLWTLPGWGAELALVAAAVLFVLTVPMIWRYSRVLWMHFDRAIDPER